MFMNTRNPFKLIAFLLLILTLGLSGCLPNFQPIQIPLGTGFIHTAAAQTIAAQATLAAGQTAVAQLTQIAMSSPTESPTILSPTATDTSQPSPTVTATLLPPSATPVPPTATPIPPSATPIPIPCEWAQFMADVTVPDGSKFAPGASFTKVWRIRNIGSCAWTAGYYLVFVGGERMHVRNAYSLPWVVRPGETVDVAADFIAPSTPSRYRSNWMLSNPSGYTFGIGPTAQRPFWVEIVVEASSSKYPYDFAANMCNAVWRNSFRTLPCPGNQNSADGSVILLNAPVLETGKRENEPALWTRPEQSRGGIISGVYPAYRVQNGDRFMADIGCLKDSRDCDVTFYLDYQVAGQPPKNLGVWREVYDGRLTRVDVDVSGLAGLAVQFILRVENNGKPSDANAFWLVPAIRRSAPVPPDWESLPAVRAARAELSAALQISPSRLTIVSVEAVQWPDSCLGIPQPGRVCAPVIIPGYRIVFSYRQQLYEVHTDNSGDLVYWFQLN
jgi:hypothetical protein